MLPNFYRHVSFSRRQFSLARILLSARLFFGPTFFFWHDFCRAEKKWCRKQKVVPKKKLRRKKKSREKET